jgi:hypothetical protein
VGAEGEIPLATRFIYIDKFFEMMGVTRNMFTIFIGKISFPMVVNQLSLITFENPRRIYPFFAAFFMDFIIGEFIG